MVAESKGILRETQESPPTSGIKRFMAQHGHSHKREGEIPVNGSETTRPVGWDDNGEAFSDGCELTLGRPYRER